MNETKSKVKILAEVAIMAALAFALDALQGGIWRGLFPNGGSIGFAMLPILLLAYRRGFLAALLSGFVLSFIQILGGFYTIADSWYMVILQFLLDYIIAYPLVAAAGVFYKSFHKNQTLSGRNKYIIFGVLLGGTLKFLAHYVSGVVFWSAAAPTDYVGGPTAYSFVYNASFMIPNIIINALALCLIASKQPKILLADRALSPMPLYEEPEECNINKLILSRYIILSISMFLAFSYFLYRYIASFKIDTSYGNDVSCNFDYLVFVLVTIIILVYCIYRTIKYSKNVNESAFNIVCICCSFMLSFYQLGVFFKSLAKHKPVMDNLSYLILGITFFFLLVYFFIKQITIIKEKENKEIKEMKES